MKIAVIMGSDSDWEIMKDAVTTLREFGINVETKVLSAHRTPEDLPLFAEYAEKNSVKVVIAGAGGAAHLPGVLAAYTTLPVIGVPINTNSLQGMDALLSIVQMPKGIPVATVGINNSTNAALLALRMCALSNETLTMKLKEYREKIANNSRNKKLE
jgi:phosphoribosylaminoimidazole carboxylase PurE protein